MALCIFTEGTHIRAPSKYKGHLSGKYRNLYKDYVVMRSWYFYHVNSYMNKRAYLHQDNPIDFSCHHDTAQFIMHPNHKGHHGHDLLKHKGWHGNDCIITDYTGGCLCKLLMIQYHNHCYYIQYFYATTYWPKKTVDLVFIRSRSHALNNTANSPKSILKPNSSKSHFLLYHPWNPSEIRYRARQYNYCALWKFLKDLLKKKSCECMRFCDWFI